MRQIILPFLFCLLICVIKVLIHYGNIRYMHLWLNDDHPILSFISKLIRYLFLEYFASCHFLLFGKSNYFLFDVIEAELKEILIVWDNLWWYLSTNGFVTSFWFLLGHSHHLFSSLWNCETINFKWMSITWFVMIGHHLNHGIEMLRSVRWLQQIAGAL